MELHNVYWHIQSRPATPLPSLLPQGYHWFAYYWEAVMEVRKMIFVFITSIDPARIGILNKYCLMLLVCLGGIFINYAQAPFIWSLANTMDIYLLLACGVSCVVMIMYDGSTHRAQVSFCWRRANRTVPGLSAG